MNFRLAFTLDLIRQFKPSESKTDNDEVRNMQNLTDFN